MTEAPSELQTRLAELRVKFAARGRTDADTLEHCAKSLASGPNTDLIEQIRGIAHRVAGTAALFGFEGLTGPAVALEASIRDKSPTAEVTARTSEFAACLRTSVEQV